MTGKNSKSLLAEILISMILVLPFVFVSEIGKGEWWFVIIKVLYSIGIMLVTTKIISLIYYLIYRKKMKSPEIIPLDYAEEFQHNFFVFALLGVIILGLHIWVFKYGYSGIEILFYIVGCIWFRIDVNTNICTYTLLKYNKILHEQTEAYEKFIDKYKKVIYQYECENKRLTEEVSSKNNIFDSWSRERFDLSHIDKYKKRIPIFKGVCYGLRGLFYGKKELRKFQGDIIEYIKYLNEAERWMIAQGEQYYICVENTRTRVEKSECMPGINRNDINQKKDVKDIQKDFWKTHKKLNKIRRRAKI